MSDTNNFTAAVKRREALREIGQRENVYPRLVAAGKMSQYRADRQMAIMRAIADDYAEPGLFGHNEEQTRR